MTGKGVDVKQDPFQQLTEIMATLRSPQGCPWDREQTHETLRPYLLEETYEVLEAIDNNDHPHLKEELGDLLLQIVFHAQIAGDENRFTIDDVILGISEKLIRRHPHVFGDAVIRTAEEQTAHWEQIKKKEGKRSAIDGIPAELPSLTRARRIQEKAASTGFDWTAIGEVYSKVKEEREELEEAMRQNDPARIEEEFGDLLFALVNLARFLALDPEAALRKAVDKFSDRFSKVEKKAREHGRDMHTMDLAALDAIWEEVKTGEVRK
ncbi:nucleoside triphosphate pyrophosphohydrolase [bacterium]|nr:nucleoside triphosphate pyrophosphohydrolase [bacterium]